MQKFSKGPALSRVEGFTIIELIVVIAIIVILATIILVNINGYINKGKDAAAKEDMSTLLTDATNFYATKWDFNGVTGDTDYAKAWTGLTSGTLNYSTALIACDNDAACATTGATKWCACIVEKAVTSPATDFCVDSSGARKEVTSTTCAAECQKSGSLGVCQ